MVMIIIMIIYTYTEKIGRETDLDPAILKSSVATRTGGSHGGQEEMGRRQRDPAQCHRLAEREGPLACGLGGWMLI